MSDDRRIGEVEQVDVALARDARPPGAQHQSEAQPEAESVARSFYPPADVKAALERMIADPQLLASLPDIIAVMDRDCRILHLNHGVPGASDAMADVVGHSVLPFIVPEMRGGYRSTFDEAWATGQRRAMAVKTIRDRWWDIVMVPMKHDGQTRFVMISCHDVTQQREAERALRDSERRLRHAIRASGMGTWEIRRGVIRWDDAICKIFGVRPEEAPRRVEEFLVRVHPDDRETVARIVDEHRRTGIYEDFEHRLVRPDGEVRHVISRGTPLHDEQGQQVGFLGGVFDITAQKQLEAQLHQAQKMEAVGQLTAGIAHNFNNALSVILHNAALCRDGADPPTREKLTDIEYAAQRAAEMVRQLMIFARADSHARKRPTDLRRSAERTLEMCRRTMDPRIVLELETVGELSPVEGNEGQLEQVLLNICLNARDAMESAKTPSPRIVIRLEPAGSAGVQVRIMDNGPGMSEAVRARIFEPFFTTKESGRGTGLGLAMAYSIIADHHGRIDCETRPGQGTSFTIQLPVTTAAMPAPADENAPVRGGHETILLIDDDKLVRHALRGILTHAGYTVVEAADGPTGLDLFGADGGPFDLVVLDRSMPRMSGEVVLERLDALGTGVPIVLLSGHPGAGGSDRSAAVLAKPIDRATLLRSVRQVLDNQAAG